MTPHRWSLLRSRLHEVHEVKKAFIPLTQRGPLLAAGGAALYAGSLLYEHGPKFLSGLTGK